MELSRDEAINRIVAERNTFKGARNKEDREEAAQDFKRALIALTRALKVEENHGTLALTQPSRRVSRLNSQNWSRNSRLCSIRSRA